ncbi:MAG: GNAT family N-acetyltransferase [Synergistaceae bacterium]|jgi:N-acetylglutamate synthase-like GNAT family acetyltransferase|nr:GNAT family N-acetyltransferase [Synergistaceae bacterium]
MDPDSLVIRPARFDEADLLSQVCFRARSYWEYPRELLVHWEESGAMSVSPEEIDENPTYLIEDEGEVLGFYTLRISGSECLIENLCVLPEFVGADLRARLFLHACEIAEASGANQITIVSDPLACGFYEEMGAERIGEKIDRSPVGDRALPVLKLDL